MLNLYQNRVNGSDRHDEHLSWDEGRHTPTANGQPPTPARTACWISHLGHITSHYLSMYPPSLLRSTDRASPPCLAQWDEQTEGERGREGGPHNVFSGFSCWSFFGAAAFLAPFMSPLPLQLWNGRDPFRCELAAKKVASLLPPKPKLSMGSHGALRPTWTAEYCTYVCICIAHTCMHA